MDRILHTHRVDGIARILDADVQAVIMAPPEPPPWLSALAAAVENGEATIPRTQLTDYSRDLFAAWLDRNLPPLPVFDPVRDDMLVLVDLLAALTGASRFMIRLLTGAPNTECGFHVDTVPPGAPQWGLLRVYNGAGTHYVEPGNVLGPRDFYDYLGQRERLGRERASARETGDRPACEAAEAAIRRLDAQRPFLRDPSALRCTPAGAIVAFKHLDVAAHWSDRFEETPWIHCSPMAGPPRLLINITALDQGPRHRRPPDARVPQAPGPGA